MAEMLLTVSEIKELMDKMAEKKLSEVSLSQGDFALCLKAERREVLINPAAQPVPVAAAPAEEEPAEEETYKNLVKSPIVGTFYAAPSPEKPAFVQVGQQVKKGDVLFIIESMKLMNEIQSECDGTVAKIFVTNGQGVEYGQPILALE